VTSVKNESLDTKTFRLRLNNWKVDFGPGQFAQLLLPGVGEAPFCIASSPRDTSNMELTIMRRGMMTTAAQYLRPGDIVGIRAPLGRPFPVESFLGRDVILVATGIGIAALRSLILSLTERKHEFRSITLLYGARFPEDLVYRDEVGEWAADAKIVVTLSKPPAGWMGLRGRVTEHLRDVDFGADSVAAVCGSPAVMQSITKELMARGLPGGSIFVSLERHMKCGIGKCARCMIRGGLHVCRDGPVFSAAEIGLGAIGE